MFTLQFLDHTQFYLVHDWELLCDILSSIIAMFKHTWTMLGRPLLILKFTKHELGPGHSLHPALVAALKKIQSGYINGTRVHLGNLCDFINTSNVTNLTFLTEKEDSPDGRLYMGYFIFCHT